MSDIENEIRRMMQAAELGPAYMKETLQDWGRRIWRVAEVQITDLQRQLAEAVGQAEAAKQATREIMGERNTWARQLADMRDERDTARDEASTQRGQRITVEVNLDNLTIEIERLIVRWEQAPPNLPTRDLRRVITRWRAT